MTSNGQRAITRHFVTVGDRQVHYRRAGSGPPMVLMHESPKSSVFLIPLLEILSSHFTVYGFDTPGYGNSDPLPMETPEIEDFADAMAPVLDALQIGKAPVYGMHTGAMIALELAARHPHRVAVAIFDGFPMFSEEERQDCLDNYLTPINVQWEGGHLNWIWARVREQHFFFPWFRQEQALRLDIDLPDAEFMHRMAMDFLRAGDGYRVGYSAAFRHLPAKAITGLKVPAAFLTREDDVLFSHLDRLPELPPSAWIERMGRDRARLAQRIMEIAIEHAPSVGAPALIESSPIAGGIARGYVNTDAGQVFLRRMDDGPGRPLVMIHDCPGGSAQLTELVRALGSRRPVVALDLPGCGDSDPYRGGGAVSGYGSVLAQAVDALGIGEYDLLACGLGSSHAMALAGAHAGRVKNTVLNGVALLGQQEREALSASYGQPVVPRWDGGHLIQAWVMVRDHELYWPWHRHTREGVRWIEPDLDPERVHRRVLEVLKSGATQHLAAQAALEADPIRALSAHRPSTLVCTAERDALHAYSTAAADAAPNAEVAVLPGDAAGCAEVINRFLDSQ